MPARPTAIPIFLPRMACRWISPAACRTPPQWAEQPLQVTALIRATRPSPPNTGQEPQTTPETMSLRPPSPTFRKRLGTIPVEPPPARLLRLGAGLAPNFPNQRGRLGPAFPL